MPKKVVADTKTSPLYLGVDLGSRTSKAVLLSGVSLEITGSAILDSAAAPRKAYAALLKRLGLAGRARARVTAQAVTGYGRGSVEGAERITEITCHARGVRRLCPSAATIIEMGGQDSKVMRLDAGGQVRDFAMNDRCAAGTGRFLEMVARVLSIDLDALDGLAKRSRRPLEISSTCVVFAESEIISVLTGGARREDVAAGVFMSLARKVAPLVERVGMAEPVVFTGGVALSEFMRKTLERVLETAVGVSPMPLLTGALGAALAAAQGLSGTGR